MDALFKKLNYKGQQQVVSINHPASFNENLTCLAGEAEIITDLANAESISFILAFVTQQSEIDRLIPLVAPKLQGDAVVWMCYPKGTSKKYRCDFNRDTGWAILGQYDLESVRAVAIDEDWSALRFRKVAYIKAMTRKFGALSEKGREKAGQEE
ncbi:MAG: hypothetical protein HUU01_18420 [Saprospiraceae bacterium]|nr:hypothetical protein [Saprospiraceae bacterium]